MKEKELVIHIINAVACQTHSDDLFKDVFEICDGDNELLLKHIRALKNILEVAEKEVKRDIRRGGKV